MKTVAKPKVFISYTWRSDDPSNPKYAEKRGLELADRLRVAGLDCRIDKYFLQSLHGFLKPQRRPDDKVNDLWVTWAEEQIKDADFVLLVCSAQYAATVCKSPLAGDFTWEHWHAVPDDLKFRPQERDLTWEQWHAMPDDLKFKIQEYQMDERERKRDKVPYTWWDWHFMIQDMASGRAKRQKFIPVGFGPYSSVSQYVPYFIKGESYYNLDSDEAFEGLLRGIKAQFPSETTETASSTIQEVVLLIHGIRDFAAWEHMVSPILEEIPGIRAPPLGYGRFDAVRFWFPIWTREAPIRKLLRRIRDVGSKFPTAKLSVIAHSFGTYAIGKILEDNPDIRLHKLILCGGILPSEFRWDKIRDRVQTEIINDCGTKDIWPVLAESTTFGYGASGRFGFLNIRVRDRFHDFGHGGFFQKEFVSEFWVPWFRNDTLVKSKPPPPPTARWHLLTIIPIKWLVVIFCIFVLVASFAFRSTWAAYFDEHWRQWTAWVNPAAVKLTLPGDTGWIFSGYYDIDNKTWQGGPCVRLVTPHRKEESIPFVIGDQVEVTRDRRVMIVDYKNSGLGRKTDSPISSGYKEDDDYTGISLGVGTKLDVRDVSVGKTPGRASAIWLRISYSDNAQ